MFIGLGPGRLPYNSFCSYHDIVDGELDEVWGPVDLVFVEVSVIAGRVLQFVVGLRPTVHGPAAAVVEG